MNNSVYLQSIEDVILCYETNSRLGCMSQNKNQNNYKINCCLVNVFGKYFMHVQDENIQYHSLRFCNIGLISTGLGRWTGNSERL